LPHTQVPAPALTAGNSEFESAGVQAKSRWNSK